MQENLATEPQLYVENEKFSTACRALNILNIINELLKQCALNVSTYIKASF